MPLAEVFARWRPGSYDETVDDMPWTWADETDDIQARGLLPRALLDSVRQQGLREPEPGEEPIILGNDGRVWSGHRRLTAGMLIGAPDAPVVVVPDADE
jgi:hypothetical protein